VRCCICRGIEFRAVWLKLASLVHVLGWRRRGCRSLMEERRQWDVLVAGWTVLRRCLTNTYIVIAVFHPFCLTYVVRSGVLDVHSLWVCCHLLSHVVLRRQGTSPEAGVLPRRRDLARCSPTFQDVKVWCAWCHTHQLRHVSTEGSNVFPIHSVFGCEGVS